MAGRGTGTELQQLPSRSSVVSCDTEAQVSDSGRKQGGWVTFPFIIGTTACFTLATGGWMSNLIVYLIEEFNVKSIDAAQISNVVNGCVSFLPLIGAIIVDSFLGSFSIISISACISLLGVVLITLTATIESLRPQPCVTNGTSFCQGPSKAQFAILYAGIALASVGVGGIRFTTATMGADQFDKPEAQGVFFNWFFVTFYAASMVSATAIVFIQDNVSWGLGFGLSTAANFIGLAIFLLGKPLYRHIKPQGSPFTDLARVVVAAARKRKVKLSSRTEDYHYDYCDGKTSTIQPLALAAPKKSFRFLNRAALKTEGDIGSDGSVAKPWRLCTLQQVEDLKTLIRILPLWTSSILLATPIAIQASLTILQALTIDRRLGAHFKIPAGSMLVLVLLSGGIAISLIDRFLFPTWQKLTGHSPTPLQRIGVGHVLNVLSMAVSALAESKRLKIAHASNQVSYSGHIVPMHAVWLFPQLVLVGIGEAFHFPGQVALYYQELPATLHNMSTGMVAVLIGIAFYLSTALIDLIRRVTEWLPDDINNGRLDNVYWVVVVVGVLNFFYYLACAKVYKYQNVEKGEGDSSSSSS